MLRSPRRVLSPDSCGFGCWSSSSFSFGQLLYMSSSPPNMDEASSSSQPMGQTAAKKISVPHSLILKHLGLFKSGDKGKLGAPLHTVSQVAGLKTNMSACKDETSVVTEHDKSQQGKSSNFEPLGVGCDIHPPEHSAEPPSSALEPKINECIDDGSKTDEAMESISQGQRPVVPGNASASSEDVVSAAKYSEQKKQDVSSVFSGSGMRKKSRAKRSKFIAEHADVTSSAGRVKQDSSCTTEFSMSEETNSMMNELKRFSLPTEFGKKRVSRGTRPIPGHPNSNEQVWRKKGSNCDMKAPNLPPFDICQSESVSSPSADVSFSMDGEEDHQNCQVSEGELVLRPGMVLLKGYLSHDEQVSIVRKCRNIGLGPGGFYQPGYKDGAKLRLMMMCLGRDWDPQYKKYGERRRVDNASPPHIPTEFLNVVRRAMIDSQALTQQQCEASDTVQHILPDMSPDICIVNFYKTTGRLGLHQDRDESRESLAKGLPVVSISVGDSADFLYGESRDISKAEKVVLESGDVLVFGGKSRHIFHGIDSIIPDSAPQSLLNETGLRPGRLNLTFGQF